MPADIFANAASAKAIRRPLPGACGGCGGADGIIAAFHQAFLPHAGTCAIQACADSVLPRNDRPVIVSKQMNIIAAFPRSEEHTSELQSLMRISYAVFCLKKKNTRIILS